MLFRSVTILMDKKFAPPTEAKLTALLVPDGTPLARALSASQALRASGVAPSLFPLEKKLGRQLEGLQREQMPRRKPGVGQNASAGIAMRVAAPALIWWLSAVLCGRTRAM